MDETLISNCKNPFNKVCSDTLTSSELSDSKLFLLQRAQADTFSDVHHLIKKKKSLPKHHPLAGMVVYNDNGMIKATGRICQHSITTPRELIPLSLKSPITRLLVNSAHITNKYPGVATSLSILGHTYFIRIAQFPQENIQIMCSLPKGICKADASDYGSSPTSQNYTCRSLCLH